MSKYSETILTANGLDLATRAANGKVKFTLTRAAATSDDLSKMEESDLQNLTALPNEKQAGTITNQDENIPNSTAVVGTEILFTNEGINEGYSINGVGLYAKEEGKDEEVLYAVNTAIEPEFMPDFADKVIMQFKITMYVIVGRTENVTVIVDPTGMASKEWVNTKIAEIDVNDKIQDSSIDNKLQKKLIYTDFKSKELNKTTQVAEAVGQMPLGLKTIDKAGNVTKILADSDSFINISNLPSNGGDVDIDHPTVGADYYAGSLANGEITERNLLWQGHTDPTKSEVLTLVRDVGSKFNMSGDGATFLIHILKTVLDKGIKGETSNLELNYNLKNNDVNEGFYTTVSVYPIYIKATDFVVGKRLSVPINGIGENLSGKNVKSPVLFITFNADKTLTIESETGYDNDGVSTGATGANYDVVVDTISTFSVQDAVAQLPAGVQLFSGLVDNIVDLTALNDFFVNVPNGIQIEMDPIAYETLTPDFSAVGGSSLGGIGMALEDLRIVNPIKIPKDKLIKDYKYKFEEYMDVIKSSDVLKNGHYATKNWNSSTWYKGNTAKSIQIMDQDFYFQITQNTVLSNGKFWTYLNYGNNRSSSYKDTTLKVIRVITY